MGADHPERDLARLQPLHQMRSRDVQDLSGLRGRQLGVERHHRDTTTSGKLLRYEPDDLEDLTRELDVLGLVAQGLTNKEIARRLEISPATVKVHVERIISKMGVADRTEAAVRATQMVATRY